ncbi:YflT domain-containing protein [Parenemella sanctibonifatiensis]|uniref:General stress protein 17M-like domain-containing protein n=1 Tax=Parenemella sanctibonifatiensis TaxID=2016505 RepID=A0A255EF77_9ACTN|nr:general stress protein [Parenemella sanctibonifatiensis]OYN89591.1 hypothetical protein CGZ92_02390 [Parenemella sanctibonifatiensis]
MAAPGSIFELEFPRSLAVFDTYAEAQEAVDFLADEKFDVGQLCIVGTNLKSVERVLGRKTWGTVILQGVQTGVTVAVLVTIMMLIFSPSEAILFAFLAALLAGIVVGVIFQALGHLMSGGRRDFTSISQTVATQYEVLCEHKSVTAAMEILNRKPGFRARQFE